MEVKEAIEFCKKEIKNSENFRDKHCLDKKDEIRINEGINGLKNITSLIKFLEAENKALKKENKAYKGMWGKLKRRFPEVIELETKYLGGKQ
jgi:predicted RNase H-like nuclease (RuvC/YqgF family)